MPSVSEPGNVEEAAAVLAGAGERGLSVSIGRAGGDVELSTSRLDRVLEHEAGDLTVTLEAGVRLRALNEQLAEHGQMLALDPPGDPTIGGLIAGDLAGPRAYGYGRPRDLLLGVTVVLADGTVANAGGKVVKNVAGYDLGKLFCGSQGRLGLVARASFRLHPLPATARTLVVEIGDAVETAAFARVLLHAQLVPSAADLLWPGRLAVLFEGSDRAVAAQLARAVGLLGGGEDGAVWAESAERQLASRGRRALGGEGFAGALARLPEALVRLGPTPFAYLPDPEPAGWSPLAERVRAELDPDGVLI